MATRLRAYIRQVFETKERVSRKEDELLKLLKVDLGKIGRFYRTQDGGALFFRSSDRRLYELTITPGSWSTRKKDKAPRGVYRHVNGDWAIRFTCGAGHLHKERVGRVKTDAIDIRNERRSRAHRKPG